MLLVRVEAVRRLVQHQHIRVVNNRLRETRAMTIAFGKRFHALMLHGFEKTHFDRAGDRFLFRLPRKTSQLGRKIEKAIHRHVRVGRRIFRQIPNQPLGRNGIFHHVESTHRHLAFASAE